MNNRKNEGLSHSIKVPMIIFLRVNFISRSCKLRADYLPILK